MKRLAAIVVICTIFALPCTGFAAALGNVSHSFPVASGTSIVAGDLVSLSGGSGGQVTLADVDNGAGLVGVATTASQSLVAIANQSSQQQIQVVTEGTANAYVSTIAGDIHSGDYVAVSPIKGIGMQAGGSIRTIGVAQADFTTSSSGAVAKIITDKSGNSKQVYIGVIPILVGVGTGQGVPAQTGAVGQLQALAQALVGHQVSVTQAVLGFVELLIALSALVTLIYGAIHGGIVAIGRNPLARSSIYTSLMQVLGMAALIVLVAIAIVYFTLR